MDIYKISGLDDEDVKGCDKEKPQPRSELKTGFRDGDSLT